MTQIRQVYVPGSTQPNKPAAGNGGGYNPLVIVAMAIALVIVVVGAVYITYNMMVRPEVEFNPRYDKAVYERDANDPKAPEVPMGELFSEENRQRYQAGDGFERTFVIHNDPRASFGDGRETFEFPAEKQFVFDPNDRRTLIEKKQAEFGQFVSRFQAPIPFTRSVEIFLDDTDAVTGKTGDWVRQELKSRNVESELVSDVDPVQLYTFRISAAEFRQRQEYKIPVSSGAQYAVSQLGQGLQFLLEPRAGTKQSSVATGFFNALKVNEGVRRRKIYVFSDGLENSPATDSFYTAGRPNPNLLAESRWPTIDQNIQRVMSCPDLRWAEVWWFMPPVEQDQAALRLSRRYWEHVLRDLCHVPADKVHVIY